MSMTILNSHSRYFNGMLEITKINSGQQPLSNSLICLADFG